MNTHYVFHTAGCDPCNYPIRTFGSFMLKKSTCLYHLGVTWVTQSIKHQVIKLRS